MRIALLTLIVSLVLVAPAAATTVALTSRTFQGGDKTGPSTQDTVTVVGEPGETNDLTVTFEAAGLVVRDDGAVVRPGAGCAADGDSVRCAQVSQSMTATVDAGNEDDHVVVVGRPAVSATVRGGDGDDTLEGPAALSGGPGADRLHATAATTLRGGPGPDVVVGSDGNDRIDESDDDGSRDLLDGKAGDDDAIQYTDRDTAVAVDLVAGVGGSAGEGDALSGFERIDGGRAADDLRGDDGSNVITAGLPSAGDDIDGRGGRDIIFGGPGADRIRGGDGDDEVNPSDGGDWIDGGAGDDSISVGNPGSAAATMRCGPGDDGAGTGIAETVLVALDCETVTRPGYRFTLRGTAHGGVVVRLGVNDIYFPPCRARLRIGDRVATGQVRGRHPVSLRAPRAAGATLWVRGAQRCRPRPLWRWLDHVVLLAAE